MAFDAARYPDAVTFGWLIENSMDVGLHCHPCGRHVVVPVRSLPFPIETPVPSLATLQVHALRKPKDRKPTRVAKAGA